MVRWFPGFLAALTLALFSTSCAKGPSVDEQATKNTNSGNANQQDQSSNAPPHMQSNLRGDIERIHLAISMARDASNGNKAQEAVALLQNAKKEVDAAIARKPRLTDEFEALKAAIDRAIPAVEGRGKEAETRLSELQTRIGAIRVNSFAQ